MAEKTKRYLKTMDDYGAAITNKIIDIDDEQKRSASEIAKFEKVSVNKMAEFTLKSMMDAAAPTIAEMPAAAHFQYSDVQAGFTEKLGEDYLKITDGLEDSVLAVLMDTLKLDDKIKQALEAAKSLPKGKKDTFAHVDICTSEEMLGKTIAMERPKINDANNNMMDKMNMFLKDMSSQLAGLTGGLDSIKSQIPNIETSVAAAMQFENLPTNIFPFEVPPELAASDFYTMAEGSGAQPDSATPSPAAISDIAGGKLPDVKLPDKIPFAEPSKDQGMIDLVKNKVIDKATDIASDKTQQVLNAAQQAASDLYQA